MDATKTGFFSKYRDYVLFNKNLIISGASAILTSALVAQLYARYDTNALANSIVAIAAEYGVYIPFFAFLFYRDNRHKYIDPLTGKRDSKKVRNDVKKLFATFSISEIIFSVTRTSAHSIIAEWCRSLSSIDDWLVDSVGHVLRLHQCRRKVRKTVQKSLINYSWFYV